MYTGECPCGALICEDCGYCTGGDCGCVLTPYENWIREVDAEISRVGAGGTELVLVTNCDSICKPAFEAGESARDFIYDMWH